MGGGRRSARSAWRSIAEFYLLNHFCNKGRSNHDRLSLRADHPSNTKTDVVAVAVHEARSSRRRQDIDKSSKGALAAAVKAASHRTWGGAAAVQSGRCHRPASSSTVPEAATR